MKEMADISANVKKNNHPIQHEEKPKTLRGIVQKVVVIMGKVLILPKAIDADQGESDDGPEIPKSLLQNPPKQKIPAIQLLFFGVDVARHQKEERHLAEPEKVVQGRRQEGVAQEFAEAMPHHDGLIFGVLKGDRMDDECKETEKDKKIEWAANHFSVFFLEGTINPTTLIYDVPLFLTPLASLMPNYVVIEAPTNDRMKYQKGVLFFFYHCVVFSQTILFPFSNVYGSDVLYVAKIHKAGGKRRCYAAVKKKSGLTFDYLMNPYAYFQE